MRDFEFLEPATVPEACRMLADLGDECRVIAGGTALLLGMRQRMLAPSHLVSLGRLSSLRQIDFDERHGLRIGALVSHADISRSPVVQARYPMLASMASRVANPQVRNQGTIGGNLCYADPSTDPPACLMVLQAQVVIQGQGGERVLGMDEFLVDYFTTSLGLDEVVTAIRLPVAPAQATGLYSRMLRTAAEHRPLVSVALLARRQGDVCREARIVVGASTPIPVRLARAEAFLAGKIVTAEVAAEAADMSASDIEPLSDMRGSAEYRRDMVRVAVRRAIGELLLRKGSEDSR